MMTLSKVIKHLQTLEEVKGGDIPVFVNGEHGEGSPEPASEDHFSVGPADITLGGDEDSRPFGISADTIIMQIGGY